MAFKYIDHLAEIAAPLTNLTGVAEWHWTRAHDEAVREIKEKIEQHRKLTVIQESKLAPADSEPIHLAAPPPPGTEIVDPVDGEYIFLQEDASVGGTGSCLTVGRNWWTAKLVANHSRKFTPAQANYRTHEQEVQTVMEGFEKNEAMLIDRKMIVLTDNKSLESLISSKTLTPRQARVYNYLSKFNFVIRYIKGEHNHIPDMPSRQYEGEAPSRYEDLRKMRDLDDEFMTSAR